MWWAGWHPRQILAYPNLSCQRETSPPWAQEISPDTSSRGSLCFSFIVLLMVVIIYHLSRSLDPKLYEVGGGGVMSALFSSKFSCTCHSGRHLVGSQSIFLKWKKIKNALQLWFCVRWEIIVGCEEITISDEEVEAMREYNYSNILHTMGLNGTKKECKRTIIEKEEEERHPSFEED